MCIAGHPWIVCGIPCNIPEAGDHFVSYFGFSCQSGQQSQMKGIAKPAPVPDRAPEHRIGIGIDGAVKLQQAVGRVQLGKDVKVNIPLFVKPGLKNQAVPSFVCFKIAKMKRIFFSIISLLCAAILWNACDTYKDYPGGVSSVLIFLYMTSGNSIKTVM